MTQTSNRILDEFAKMFGNAASAAQGVRTEIDTLVRSQAERILNDLDVVQREEFDAVREMAAKAREENEALAARVAELEKALKSTKSAGTTRSSTTSKATAARARKTSAKSSSAKPATTKTSRTKTGKAKTARTSTTRSSTS